MFRVVHGEDTRVLVKRTVQVTGREVRAEGLGRHRRLGKEDGNRRHLDRKEVRGGCKDGVRIVLFWTPGVKGGCGRIKK